jgi:23S rRNA (uracil1939-C5)-methyltransferase
MARGSEEFIVVPEGWLSRGEAFVRGDGTQLAVFGGIPGERARVRMVERAGHQERARFVRAVGQAHPNRVEPPCDRYVPCGRCSLMHLDTSGQDRARMDLLSEAFHAAGVPPGGPGLGAGFAPDPTVRGGAEDVLHTLELVAGYSDERHVRLGVPGRDGRRVVPIPQCLLVTSKLRALMTVTAHQVQALSIWPWENGRGSIRGVLARHSATTGELLITFVFARMTPFAAQLAEAVAAGIEGVVGVSVHWNDEPGPLVGRDPVTGAAEAKLVYGKPTVDEEIDGVRVRIGAFDPFPAHPRLGARLWTDVVDALAPDAGDAVVDLGAGAGLRTLLLARRSGWALGIDPRENVVRRARENAVANAITAEFIAASADEGLETARPRLAGRRPLVVADIGGKGLEEATVAELVALSPRRVALIGANPRALARDIARFVSGGFELQRLVPYDTMPNTPFGDAFALLASRDLAAPTLRAPRRKTVRAS